MFYSIIFTLDLSISLYLYLSSEVETISMFADILLGFLIGIFTVVNYMKINELSNYIDFKPEGFSIKEKLFKPLKEVYWKEIDSIDLRSNEFIVRSKNGDDFTFKAADLGYVKYNLIKPMG